MRAQAAATTQHARAAARAPRLATQHGARRLEAHAHAAHAHKQQQQPNTREQQHAHLDWLASLLAMLSARTKKH